MSEPSPYFLRNGKKVVKKPATKTTIASKLSALDISDTPSPFRRPSESLFQQTPPSRCHSDTVSPTFGPLEESIIISPTMNHTFAVHRDDEHLSSSGDDDFDPLKDVEDEEDDSASDNDTYYDPADLGQAATGQQTELASEIGFKFLKTQQDRPKLALNSYHYTIDSHNPKTDTDYWKFEYAPTERYMPSWDQNPRIIYSLIYV